MDFNLVRLVRLFDCGKKLSFAGLSKIVGLDDTM
jgi:hypothetical protein